MAGENKLAVAHVNLALGYRGNERQIELLIKELASLGVPQALICREDSPLAYHLEGVKGLKFYRIRGSDPRFMGHFKVGRYSIIHAHDLYGVQWAFFHYLLRGIPYVITERDEDPSIYGFVNKTAYKTAAAIVGVSEIIKDTLSEYLGVEAMMVGDCSSRLMPNENVTAHFKEALKHRFVIGNISPLINRQKGQSVLIDAAKILQEKIPEIVVVFVGGGDDVGLLQRHAKDMPFVKFVGFKRNYIDYMSCFDVFAYPANYEAKGSIILDAMEQGVPVVASKVGGIPDIIKHDETGYLIEPGDSKALANYIMQLYEDRNMYYRIVHNARNVASDHSSSVMAAQYYRIYINILNRKKGLL